MLFFGPWPGPPARCPWPASPGCCRWPGAPAFGLLVPATGRGYSCVPVCSSHWSGVAFPSPLGHRFLWCWVVLPMYIFLVCLLGETIVGSSQIGANSQVTFSIFCVGLLLSYLDIMPIYESKRAVICVIPALALATPPPPPLWRGF